MKTLDIGAVRAFALTAELQSFTRTAHALGTTQSAISLKLRKLEQQLGRRLLERTPRQVRLSADGFVFLEAARGLVAAHDRATTAFELESRRLAVGISQQLVGGELPALLCQLKSRDPSLLIELRIAGTRELMQAYEKREIDAALVLRPEDGCKRGRAVFTQSFSWFALPGWKPYAGQPLPLATQGEGCRIRTMAVRALDKSGIAWTEVFIGRGGAALGAAAAAGLAVALLAKSTAPIATVDVSNNLALPLIPDQEVVLYSAFNDTRSREALRILTLAFQSK